MKYLLDTNVVSVFFDANSRFYKNTHTKIRQLGNDDELCVSILTVYELEYSKANAPIDKLDIIKKDIEHILNSFCVLPLTVSGSVLFGELKKNLKNARNISRENIKKHNVDIMLASTAIVEGCVLVSGDQIFQKLSGLDRSLKVENWTIDRNSD